MSVIEMSPCILSERWSEVVEWCAHILDLPVSCKFATEGWARLCAASEGITVVDPRRLGMARGARMASRSISRCQCWRACWNVQRALVRR